MIQIDLATLVKRLNPFSKQALEMAASECMSQQAAEITVAHVLIQMLAITRSDLRVIAERADTSVEDLRQTLTVENYATSRSVDSYPSFSPMLVEWLKESWLLASAQMQQTELRGGTLLLALLHSPLRYVPPAAARLLTNINRDQLQQDFTGWTKESAESVVLTDGQPGQHATVASDETLLGRYTKNMDAGICAGKAARGQLHHADDNRKPRRAPDGDYYHTCYRQHTAAPGTDVQLRGQYHPDAGGADPRPDGKRS